MRFLNRFSRVIEDKIRFVLALGILVGPAIRGLVRFRSLLSWCDRSTALVGDCFEQIAFDHAGLVLAEAEGLGHHTLADFVEQRGGVEGESLATL